MKQINGFYWPEGDTRGRVIISHDCQADVDFVLSHVRGRDLIVQAGANVGLYPLALADHFQRVITVEPDAENWDALKANLEARDSLNRVNAYRAAFGLSAGRGGMIHVEADNCGAHRVGPGMEFPVRTLDSFELPVLDCLWLDVEGSELFALEGAKHTLERLRPVVVVEEKGLGGAYGVEEGAVSAFLHDLGYRLEATNRYDNLYKPV